jgi:Skp family chaperone for outer membrane proteins
MPTKQDGRREQMQRFRKFVAGALLVACVVAQAQSGVTSSPAKHASAKATKVKEKTREEVLLEQLNDKFQKLDALTEKYGDLQEKYDALQKHVTARDAELDQARKDAAEAKRQLEAAQEAIGPNGAAVSTLQSEVTKLKDTSTSLSTKVDATEQTTKKLEHPDVIRFKGIDITPGGFLAGETVDRQRATGSDVNTPFNSIPFAGQTAGVLSEFNASGRQSRVSLLTESKMPAGVLRGYFETDFLSAGTTSNNNQSNGYTMRLRQAWAQAALGSGWTLTGGQMWSLATEYAHGLDNRSEALPLTIDSQYNVGFTWERQYGFRAVKQISPKFWIGGSVEESQTLGIGGHNLPTIAYQTTGTSGGLYSPTSNYSINYAPDLLAKAAYETNWGHFEVFGVGRFFRDRVFPNGAGANPSATSSTTSATGAFTSKTAGGGAGANARVAFFDKSLTVGAHILAGNGIGRYSTSQLPDATAHPDGSLELLTGGSALGSVEWHGSPRLDLYAYYGGEYAKRAWYNTGYTSTTAGSTYGQPILGGYGAPTNIVYGCYTEVLPTTSSTTTGTATNCNADTRNIQEGTVGYWFRFYRGVHGTLQQGIQYSYAVRHTWEGIGDINNNLPNSPKAIENMWFTSFRYYLPK